MNHDRVLWVLQWPLGLFFIAFGLVHFTVPAGLPEQLSWLYDLSDTMHLAAGTAEIIGGLGLILPGLTGIMPELTPVAATGLGLVMVGAIVFHSTRGELASIAINLLVAAVLAYVAYGRWRLEPLEARA
jgi:uncharacterized membrane protein YphA (DoxX/SURF4 family)